MATADKVPEYVTREWTEDVVTQCFAAIKSELLGAEWENYKDRVRFEKNVIPMIDGVLSECLTDKLHAVFNQVALHYSTNGFENGAALGANNSSSESRRTIVLRHDDRGRIVETVSLPLTATEVPKSISK